MVKILSAIGIAGGVAAFAALFITGDVFGLPGSEKYRIYATFNRAMGFFLLLQVCSLISFSMQYRSRIGRIANLSLYVAVVGWLGMAAGTAAEFWLYSDLSYGEQNMRQVAFGVFSLSGLLVGVGLLVLGVDLFRSRFLPRGISIAIMAYLAFDILFFLTVGIFLAPALWAILIGATTLPVYAGRFKAADTVVDREV